MKKLAILLFLPLVFSCGKETSEKVESGNILEKLTITVDTLMIDSKDKLFDLNMGPRSSSISEDEKFLFLFNSRTTQIQQINLDKLEWERDIDFEVEGPDGIGDAFFGTKALGDGTFLITGYRKMGIFDDSGNKIKDFSISSLPISTDLEELDYGIILSEDQKSLFSLPGIRFYEPRTFAKIDLQTYEIDNFPIKEMDWIFDLKVGSSTNYLFDEYMYLKEFNNQILVLSPSSSAFYRYDLETDSMTYHSFVHQLSPVANDIKLKNIVESDDEYREERSRFNMAYKLGPPIWDESRELYFRFGKNPLSIDDSFQITSSQVFLYVYDRNFKLVGEAELPEISKVPEYPFFKDGKLWFYVNVNDELGFAVIDFKF